MLASRDRARIVESLGELIARRAPMGEQWPQLARIAAEHGFSPGEVYAVTGLALGMLVSFQAWTSTSEPAGRRTAGAAAIGVVQPA